ncbi:MAG: biotin synthase BioB [Deltaproteobacteria bacterium]|nr:biotin synthase BioB [Deltaproteobacteria bacterium]
MNSKEIFELAEKIISGEEVGYKAACDLIRLEGSRVYDLLAAANRIREHFKGNKVSLCSIVNAKSGRCPEDCSFCGQSAFYNTNATEYGLIEPEVIADAAEKAKGMKSREFSIVTSGTRVESEKELEQLCQALQKIGSDMERCASLGIMERDSLLRLKEAGLESYHHNLETARSFFPNICTTHDYEEDVNTVRMAKELGFKTCCGGILGLGESLEQRVEMAFTLKDLDVDSIPMNFLNPIKGTKMEGMKTVQPLDGLKTIAIYRFILPKKNIIVSGGREVTFRDLQSMIFMAGANGTLIGNYLLTKGRKPDELLQMIEDLGLEVENY